MEGKGAEKGGMEDVGGGRKRWMGEYTGGCPQKKQNMVGNWVGGKEVENLHALLGEGKRKRKRDRGSGETDILATQQVLVVALILFIWCLLREYCLCKKIQRRLN